MIDRTSIQNFHRSLQLDWRSATAARLNHYAMGTIDTLRIDDWLRQFERLGNHRHVGEHLLQLIDVLPFNSLGDALSTDADFYGADLVVGFNIDKWGKSWATVSTLIAKKCGDAQLLPINEAVEAGEHPRVLRLVEDGLFTGTEIRAILESLRGTRGEGQSQKVPRLADPALLARVVAHLQFGVVCDYGEAVLRQYATENGLPNIHVTVSSATRKFRVLLTAGTTDPHTPATSFREQLRTRVIPYAFQNDKGGRDPRALQRAQVFCQNIGEQLWRNYIERKAYTGIRWPDERIRICGLGMEGLGLTFAFPHSVPRATLPVFWASGPVVWEGETFEWQLLFPSANS